MDLKSLIDLELVPLWISLKTSLTATVFTFFLGIFIAWKLAFYHGRGKGLIDGVLVLPMVLPPTVVGFILLLIFGRSSPLGMALTKLGVTIVFSWPATVIAAIAVALPIMYKSARAAFEQINLNVIDAARTLGASEWVVFWRVTIPLAWPGIVAGTILSFARALGEFGATLMLAGSIPDKTQTIPVAIFFAVESGELALAAKWVFVIVVLSLGAVWGLNRLTGSNSGIRR